jgi:hypothetical protein
MSDDTTNDILNRLWVIHNRSLPSYLAYARPWWESDDQGPAERLNDIVRDQQEMADRIGRTILENGGQLIAGEFPVKFAALHDLGSEHLRAELIRYQSRTVDAVELLAEQLPPASFARALAQEALGMAKAHLDSLN